MNIIGKWKIIEMMTMGEDGLVFKTKDEILGAIEDEYERKQSTFTFDTITEYKEDGSIVSILPVPEDLTPEQIKEAKEDGEKFTDDDLYLILEEKDAESGWKEENGKLFINSGIKGTIFDEEYNPWEEVEVIDDNNFKYLMLKYSRI